MKDYFMKDCSKRCLENHSDFTICSEKSLERLLLQHKYLGFIQFCPKEVLDFDREFCDKTIKKLIKVCSPNVYRKP